MKVTFKSKEIEKSPAISETLKEITVIRLIDNKKAKKIVVQLSNGIGRKTLFEEADYPINGIFDKTEDQIKTAVKKAIGAS